MLYNSIFLMSQAEIPVLYIEMDGTGVPVTASEAEGRKGKNGDQPAHTREVKLGCVFTQTTTDQEGRPRRDDTSTTYAGAIETAEEFGRRMYRQAWQRGWSRAAKKVIIADGAIWIWNLADREFPARFRLWIFITLASTCGYSPENYCPPTSASENAGSPVYRKSSTLER